MSKTIIFLLVCSIIFSSCVTYNKCIEKFGATKIDTTTIIQVDTLSINQTIRDTVTKHLPGEVVIVKDSIPCPDLINKTFKGKSSKGTVEAEVDIKNNKITVKCAADSLVEVLQTRDREITILKSQITTIKPKNQFTDTRGWWQKIPWYWAIPLWLICIIILIVIIKKLFA